MKACVQCGEEKSLDDFSQVRDHRSGTTYETSRCRPCFLERSKEHQRQFHSRNPHYERERSWKRQGINIDWATYEEMVTRVHGHCEVCNRHLGFKLRVDHDHETGRIRGLLCDSCNVGLGQLGDSYEVVLAAAEYLARS